MTTAAQEVRDNLVAHDVRTRRAIGGQQRLILARQRDMERRIQAAIEEIDPAGVKTELQRARRLKKIQEVVTRITQETYAEHARQSREYLLQIARAETYAVTGAIEESV